MSKHKTPKSTKARAADRMVARPDPELAKALAEVAQSLPKNFDVNDWAIKRQVQGYTKACTNNNSERHKVLNGLFDQLYGVYVYLYSKPLALESFLSGCRGEGITVHSGTNLSDVLVEFYVRGRSKKAVKYARALSEAAMQKIKVGGLTVRLGNVGPHGMKDMQPTSIKELAERFAKRPPSAALSQGKPSAITKAAGPERPDHFPDYPQLERLLASYAPEIGSFSIPIKRRNARALRKFLFGSKGLKKVPEDGGVLELPPLRNGWTLRLYYHRRPNGFKAGAVTAYFISPLDGPKR